jgi:hypothetical protein
MAKSWVVYRAVGEGEGRECGLLEPDEWGHLIQRQSGRVTLVRVGFTLENAAERFVGGD